jgi:hypothetical protein
VTPQQHGIRRLLEACDGCMMLAVCRTEVAGLPRTGDRVADTVKSAAALLIRRIGRRSRARAAPCVFCDAPLWRGEPPAAILVLMPFGLSEEHDVAGVLICARCAAGRTDCELTHRVIDLMPDARILPPPVAAVGHA